MCWFTSPPPPPAHLGGGGGGTPHAATCLAGVRRGGETGVKPPHAGWPRIQKILAFVTLIPHMQSGQGQNHLAFLRKAYFLRVKLGSLERKLPRLGIDIFFNFLTLQTF
jgi:hypothetical protein